MTNSYKDSLTVLASFSAKNGSDLMVGSPPAKFMQGERWPQAGRVPGSQALGYKIGNKYIKAKIKNLE